jgi:hypothetical protein
MYVYIIFILNTLYIYFIWNILNISYIYVMIRYMYILFILNTSYIYDDDVIYIYDDIIYIHIIHTYICVCVCVDNILSNYTCNQNVHIKMVYPLPIKL